MTDRYRVDDPRPGMMGDGTEEQNLSQSGDPSARIGQDEVEGAFGGQESNGLFDGRPRIRERLEASQEWLADQKDAALRWSSQRLAQAEQALADRPVIVMTASALSAMTVGLVMGFLLGRAEGRHDHRWRH